MDKGFENMDNRFRNLDSEVSFSSSKQDWKSAEQMLDNAFLDNAFVNAASTSVVSESINFDELDDAFMNDAFVRASESSSINFDKKYWEDFKVNETQMFQDNAFVEAASASSVSYKKEFWNDADQALKNEGLHYEYQSAYWKEAEKLLNKVERRAFFFRWSSVAIILLLLGFTGLKFGEINQFNNELSTIGNQLTEKVGSEITVENNTDIQLSEIESNVVVNLGNSILESIEQNESIKKNNIAELSTDNNISNENKLKTNHVITSDGDNVVNAINKITNSENELSIDANLLKESNNVINKINITPNKTSISQINVDYNIGVSIPTEIEFTPKNKAVHTIGIKLSKGLGNNFENTLGMLSARNALHLDYRFSPITKFSKFEFGVNAGLYHMNLNNYEYENNYSVYYNSGDVDHYWYKMTYKDLVFVSTNFNIFYKLNAKNKVNVNIGFDRLVTSRIKSEYQDIKEVHVDEGSEWGINKGVNKTDINLGLGYELVLSPKFSFTFDTNIGILDKMNNDYLQRVHNDRDVSLMLGVKYNILSIKK